MKSPFLLVIFILLLNIQHTPVYANANQSLIIGGEVVPQGEETHHAAIYSRISIPGAWNYECGASILSDNWVVTAAHCVTDPTKFYQVRTGDVDRGVIEQYPYLHFTINRIIPHSDWIFGSNEALQKGVNIALVEIKENFSRVGYSPISLPTPILFDSILSEETSVKAIGWGATNPLGGARSHELMRTYFVPRSDFECKGQAGVVAGGVFADGIDMERHTCVYDVWEENAVCNGDGGGSLSANVADRDYLIGVTSFAVGSGDCLSNVGMFVDVAYHVDWIRQVTGLIERPTGSLLGACPSHHSTPEPQSGTYNQIDQHGADVAYFGTGSNYYYYANSTDEHSVKILGSKTKKVELFKWNGSGWALKRAAFGEEGEFAVNLPAGWYTLKASGYSRGDYKICLDYPGYVYGHQWQP